MAPGHRELLLAYLAALDAVTGRVLWTSRDAGPSFAPPTLLGDALLAGDGAGVLRTLDAGTGRTLWRERAPGPLSAGIAVAGGWAVTGTGFHIPGAGEGDTQSGILAYRLG